MIMFSEENGVGTIMLNRPQALNALTHDMVLAMHEKLTQWEAKENIRSIDVRSAQENVFCAGADIRAIYTLRKKACQFFEAEYALNRYIRHYPKPYIAYLDGLTLGGGVGISMHGSPAIATAKLRWGMPETGIGFFPDVGASYFLPRFPHAIGIYLGLTGNYINAADAHKLHIIQNMPNVPPSLPDPQEIHRCFSAATVEEILENLRQAKTTWHQATVNTLLQKSPTSLKVTLRQLQLGASMDFEACLHMEYRLALRFLEAHDFFEGIRAAVIDKDRAPRWQPARLADVGNISPYFSV